MNQQDNQSIVIEGASEIALEDLSMQNAEVINGGLSRSTGRRASADDVWVDGKIITAENFG